MFGTENVIVKVRDPLLARNGGVEVRRGCVQVLGHTIPVKGRVFVDQVSR